MDELAKRIKFLRLERDMTIDMFVYDFKQKYDIEISKSNVSRWENGINEPSLHYARYLCDYYNVSLDYLIGLTDTKTPVNVLIKSRERTAKKEGKKLPGQTTLFDLEDSNPKDKR